MKNMSFNDWRKAKEYVNLACKKASEESNRTIYWRIYEMYDGDRGIEILLFDDCELLNTWYSGIHNRYQDLVNSIDKHIKEAMCY